MPPVLRCIKSGGMFFSNVFIDLDLYTIKISAFNSTERHLTLTCDAVIRRKKWRSRRLERCEITFKFGKARSWQSTAAELESTDLEHRKNVSYVQAIWVLKYFRQWEFYKRNTLRYIQKERIETKGCADC